MERYSSYKPTSMQWLKEIPSHWEEKRLKYFVTIKSGDAIRNQQLSDEGEYPVYGGGQCIGYSDRYNTTAEDLLIGRVGAKCGCVTFPGIKSWATDNALILSTNFNRRLLSYILIACDLNRLNTSNAQPLITSTKVKNTGIPIPPLAEQEKIVSYLEDKTSKIDAYVADKEKEIELLQELKQKTIADAVTKGLNPDAKMKDSGISWIGEIPEHWEVRHLSQVSYEHYMSNKEVHHQNLLSLSYGRIIRKDINTTEGLLPASFDTYQIVEEGNIVMRLTDLQNDHKSLRVGLVKEEGIVTSAYVCLGVFDSMIPSFLYNVLHSYDIKKLFYSMGGGLRQNLNWQGLKKLDIPLPPSNEQQAIVAYIEEKCEKIAKLASELQSEIDYLKEYKQRLIADCVTGQVNVQNV